jgi:hypothetical protein
MGAKPGLRRTALLGALAMVAMLSACSFANQNVRPSPEAPSVTSIQPAAPSSTGYQELPTTTSQRRGKLSPGN